MNLLIKCKTEGEFVELHDRLTDEGMEVIDFRWRDVTKELPPKTGDYPVLRRLAADHWEESVARFVNIQEHVTFVPSLVTHWRPPTPKPEGLK